jgi:hypothetical protein
VIAVVSSLGSSLNFRSERRDRKIKVGPGRKKFGELRRRHLTNAKVVLDRMLAYTMIHSRGLREAILA